jgi:hypothetical protein
MDERRRKPRPRALKTGRIIFNNRCSTIDCMVRNLSVRGAKLIVDTQVGIPATFDLEFPASGTNRLCKVIWRKQGELGIEFA